MDPFSAATALIPLVTLAGSCLAECYRYGCTVRDASAEARQLVDELTSLSGVLVGLHGLAISADDDDTLRGKSSEIKHLVSECKFTLQDVSQQIQIATGTTSNVKKSERLLRRALWPVKKQQTLEMVACVERLKTKLSLAVNGISTQLALQQKEVLQNMASDVKEIATKLANDAEGGKRQSALEWLTPYDPSLAHRRALEMRCEDTCNWILQDAAFERWWNSSKHCALWINGLAGYGKTVLASFVIETLRQKLNSAKGNLAYHYFDASDGTSLTLSTLLGSIVKQLCIGMNSLPKNIVDEYDAQMIRKGSPKPPDVSQLHGMLDDIICNQESTIIVLDGVDESPESEAICEVLNALADEQGLAHVLLFSRPDARIRREVSHFEELQMPESVLQDDIGRYVVARMKTEPRFGRLNDQLRAEASEVIQLKSQGMFRWAQCQLDDICKLRTDRAVRQALNTLPQNLEDAYTLMLARIAKPDVELARKALMWLAYSPSLLVLAEVAEAATYEAGCKSIDTDDRLADSTDIVEICGSLIAFDVLTQQIRLAHQSVRECLETLRPDKTIFAMPEKTAHREMAEICLSYILMDDFATGTAKTSYDLRELVTKYPLLEYAVNNWVLHVLKADAETDMQDKIMRLLTPEPNPRFLLWLQVIIWGSGRVFTIPGRNHSHTAQPYPLYYAASYGLQVTVESLINAGADINIQAGRFGGTALHAACWRDHPNIARYLLEEGADPRVQDHNGMVPADLAAFSASNYPTFVELMFEHSRQSEVPNKLASAVSMFYNNSSGTATSKPMRFTKTREYWRDYRKRTSTQEKSEVFEVG